MTWCAFWFLLGAAHADLIDLSQPRAPCEPCPEGQEERACKRSRLGESECDALREAGWVERCSPSHLTGVYCAAPGARDIDVGRPPPPYELPTDGPIRYSEAVNPAVHEPPLEVPSPALTPEEQAAEDAAAARRALAAVPAVEPSGCGCASSAWSPGLGAVLLLAAGARRRRS